MPIVLRRAAALFLGAHGFAHVLGFVGSWQLGEFEDAPYTTVILNGALSVGDVGVRVVGLLWLVGAGAFLWAAVAVWRGSERPVALAAGLSLGICVVGLPAAIVGLWIDVAILAALVIVTRIQPARRAGLTG